MSTAASPFFDELRWRGFIEAVTSDDLDAYLAEARRTIYVGFDASADSLHLGNLIPVMALAHAQRKGHRHRLDRRSERQDFRTHAVDARKDP